MNPDAKPYFDAIRREIKNHDRIMKIPKKENNIDLVQNRLNTIKMLKKLHIIALKNNILDKSTDFDFCGSKETLIREIAAVDTLYWQMRKHVVLFDHMT